MKLGIKKLIVFCVVILVMVGFVANIISLNSSTKSNQSLAKVDASNSSKDKLIEFELYVLKATLAYMDAIVDKASLKVAPELFEEHRNAGKWWAENKNIIKEIYIENKRIEKFDKLSADFEIFYSAGNSLLKDIDAKKINETDKYDDDIDSKSAEIQSEIQEEVKYSNDIFKTSIDELKAVQKTGSLLAWGTLATSLFLGFAIAFILTRLIRKTLDAATGEIMTNSSQINATSVNFDTLGKELSTSMEKQASALQETVAAVEEINHMVAKNTQGAATSVNYSEECRESAIEGKNAVAEMQLSLERIETNQKNAVQKMNANNLELEELVGVIKNIMEKTNVINDIVFQTKLLSFNASVEAARAGENGKGFAVVAEEVGSLANLSGTAAKEINEILNEGVSKVEKIVELAKKSVEEINTTSQAVITQGSQSAADCTQAIEKISSSVDKMKEIVISISNASKEQQTGLQEITQALIEIDKLTINNSERARNCASQASDLLNQSLNLKETVTTLQHAIDA